MFVIEEKRKRKDTDLKTPSYEGRNGLLFTSDFKLALDGGEGRAGVLFNREKRPFRPAK